MDLDHLRKLAGIGEQNQMKSLAQEMAERRRAIMQNVMKEQKEEQLELQSLPYKITDLAPVLSKENVDYHYDILSRGYVNRYNNNEGDADFNYGGAKLHNLWQQQFKPAKESSNYGGPIKQTIDANYGDLKGLEEKLVEAAMTIQGSGWVYLSKKGEVKTTPNQTYKADILMPIDMWEHSFSDYTKEGKECKKKYIQNMMRIINWDVINQRLA